MRKEYFLNEPDFRAENIDILEIDRPKGFKHSFKYGRSKHGFIYTISGSMKYTFHYSKNVININAGEVIFIPKGQIYNGEYSQNNTKIKIVQFDIKDGQMPDYLTAPTVIQLPNVAKLIESFFENIDSPRKEHTFYYLHCFYNLMWQIDESYYTLPKKYKKLQPALFELTEYPEKNLPVLYYSDLCNISEVGFRRCFKEFTGKSPIEYRNDIRLNKAKKQLESGQYTVAETAEECGFSNLSFFTRLYKRRFGHSPKK